MNLPLDIPTDLAQAKLYPEDRVAAALWLKHRNEHTLKDIALMRRLLALRAHNRPGYLWLVNNDLEAAAIKVKRGWHDREDEAGDWTDPDAILASVRAVTDQPHHQAVALMNIIRSAVERHAPNLLHLVPPMLHARMSDKPDPAPSTPPPPHQTEPRPEPDPDQKPGFDAAAFEARRGRKVGALDAEVLAKVRADNGLFDAAMKVVAADRVDRERAAANGMNEAAAQHAAEAKAAKVIDLFPLREGGE